MRPHQECNLDMLRANAHHFSRFSLLASRFSLLASRFSLLASRFSLLASIQERLHLAVDLLADRLEAGLAH